MQVTVSKWGNSLGIRIPTSVVETMVLKSGDVINYKMKDDELILKKETSTKEIFEAFYGKPYNELTSDDLGSGGEINWGEDQGGERF